GLWPGMDRRGGASSDPLLWRALSFYVWLGRLTGARQGGGLPEVRLSLYICGLRFLLLFHRKPVGYKWRSCWRGSRYNCDLPVNGVANYQACWGELEGVFPVSGAWGNPRRGGGGFHYSSHTIVALRSFTSPGYSGRRSDHVHSGRRTGRSVAASRLAQQRFLRSGR